MQLTPTFHIIRNVYKPRKRLLTTDDVIDMIYSKVFRETKVSKLKIQSETHKRVVINAKRIVMYLIYNYTNLSLKNIAIATGLENHTTTRHHLIEIVNLTLFDKEYKILVKECEAAVSMYKMSVKRDIEYIVK